MEFAYNLSRHSTTGLALFHSLYGEGRHPARESCIPGTSRPSQAGTPSSTRIVYSGNVAPKPGGGMPAVRAGRCCCHQNNSRYAASILSSSRNLWAPFKIAALRGVNTGGLSIPRRSQFGLVDTVVNVNRLRL